jgi:methylated-DNA-[protein]-cysteine S-methyltransferase
MMKKHVRQLLEQQSMDQIVELAERRRRVLSILVSLTFDKDPLIGWRAVEAMGMATQRIARDDPQCVRDHLRRLYWLLSEESGGICWHSPQAMAETVCRTPELFSDYVPIVVSLITEMADEDLVQFRPGVLWAIGKLGSASEGHLDTVLPTIETCLDHPDPQVRGMAVWCLEQVGRTNLLIDRTDLLRDTGPVDLYEDGALKQTTVAELAGRARRDGPSGSGSRSSF